jgi:hypothetical protein
MPLLLLMTSIIFKKRVKGQERASKSGPGSTTEMMRHYFRYVKIVFGARQSSFLPQQAKDMNIVLYALTTILMSCQYVQKRHSD